MGMPESVWKDCCLKGVFAVTGASVSASQRAVSRATARIATASYKRVPGLLGALEALGSALDLETARAVRPETLRGASLAARLGGRRRWEGMFESLAPGSYPFNKPDFGTKHLNSQALSPRADRPRRLAVGRGPRLRVKPEQRRFVGMGRMLLTIDVVSHLLLAQNYGRNQLKLLRFYHLSLA